MLYVRGMYCRHVLLASVVTWARVPPGVARCVKVGVEIVVPLASTTGAIATAFMSASNCTKISSEPAVKKEYYDIKKQKELVRYETNNYTKKQTINKSSKIMPWHTYQASWSISHDSS